MNYILNLYSSFDIIYEYFGRVFVCNINKMTIVRNIEANTKHLNNCQSLLYLRHLKQGILNSG